MYDISALESLIERHCPALMRAGSSKGTGAIRGESRPKSCDGALTGFSLISPAMSKAILAMNKDEIGSTEIGAHFRIGTDAVRAHLRKNFVKSNPAKLKASRSSVYSGTAMHRIK